MSSSVDLFIKFVSIVTIFVTKVCTIKFKVFVKTNYKLYNNDEDLN